MNEERRIENIPIEKIIPNIYQPRIKFDNDAIEDLSKSIQDHGIIQPLILRKIGEKYEIVDGERRYKAAKKAELKTLPSIVLEISEEEAAELILTENMQKQKLSPIEEANAYQQLMLLNNFDITEISEKLGKEKKTIENKLKLLTLHPEIQEALLNNKISEGHAKALTKLDSRTKQLEIYNKILKERIPVKELEKIVNNSLNNINPFNDIKLEKNKTEVEFMDNSQLNFNQYNDLLKEQEKPQMEATTTPEPILSNIPNQANNFFPSLEDQPLNLEVPVETEVIPSPMEMPQFEVPAPMMPETPVAPEMVAPIMEAPQMPETMAMPQFEVPAPMMPETPVVPEMVAPVMEAPQMPETMAMPQFEMPTPMMSETPVVSEMASPTMEAPQMPETMAIPQFEMPTPMMPETSVAPEMAAPVMETPQQNSVNIEPVVNIIKNLLPLLETAGYRAVYEENDTPSEYQMVIKVQK